MRVVCTILAALWLAVVTGGTNQSSLTPLQSSSTRCCPSLFTVDPNPQEFHFRCEVANLTGGCDNLSFMEDVPDTAINTDGGGGGQCGNSYIMTDPNWQDMEDFRANIACAYYLPPMEGCRWELLLLKSLDPIVGDNNCQCDCEDNVVFEEVNGQSSFLNKNTFCDFTPDGNTVTGFCGDPTGPQNVNTLPFVTDVNTGVLTTFRSDNMNGAGEGAFVFATAVPVVAETRVSLTQPPATWTVSRKQKAYCKTLYILCKYWIRNCTIPCECYFDRQRRISCTLYAIFTDATGRTAWKHYRSPKDVIRRAARLAISNIRRFGRPIPTFSQLA